MVQVLPEICLPPFALLKRYIIPSLDLIDRVELAEWGYAFLPIEEVGQRLKQTGHTDNITSQTLLNWDIAIGLRVKVAGVKTGKKGIYRPFEVDQLDDFYRAIHLVKMTIGEYEKGVLNQGSTLHEYLNLNQKKSEKCQLKT